MGAEPRRGGPTVPRSRRRSRGESAGLPRRSRLSAGFVELAPDLGVVSCGGRRVARVRGGPGQLARPVPDAADTALQGFSEAVGSVLTKGLVFVRPARDPLSPLGRAPISGSGDRPRDAPAQASPPREELGQHGSVHAIHRLVPRVALPSPRAGAETTMGMMTRPRELVQRGASACQTSVPLDTGLSDVGGRQLAEGVASDDQGRVMVGRSAGPNAWAWAAWNAALASAACALASSAAASAEEAAPAAAAASLRSTSAVSPA